MYLSSPLLKTGLATELTVHSGVQTGLGVAVVGHSPDAVSTQKGLGGVGRGTGEGKAAD